MIRDIRGSLRPSALAGAATRENKRAHPFVNATRTDVRRVGLTADAIYVEYGDGQVAQFRGAATRLSPTLRNPDFVGYPLSVPAGVWS